MTTRRHLVLAIGAGLAAAPLAAFGQQPAKVWRIGFLGRETAAGYARELEAFRAGLKDFGYIEGKNLVIEYRWAEGVDERLPQLAAELVRQRADILVTHSTPGVRAALRVTTTVPVVFASMAGDPVSEGLAKSWARPGGNITGSASLSGTVNVKQLELVKDAFPRARRVAYMATPSASGQTEKGMETAAQLLKIDLQLAAVTSVNEFEAVIAGMAERRTDAMIVSTQPLFLSNSGRIAALAARQRIPALGGVAFAEGGGLIGYGTDIRNSFRRTAYFIDRIFNGAKPGDLPIEQPTNIELVVNMKTAKALGIKIPQSILARANRVIE